MRVPAFIFLFLSAFAIGQQAAQDPPELVFTNVNVIDTRSGQVANHLTVVIKHGHVDAIAKVGLIANVKNIQVVNASGKYLIPGLWDMHVHTAGGSADPWDEKIVYPLEIANGITGVRDMGGDTVLLEQRRARIDKGELLGPHIVMAGPFLSKGKSDQQTIGVNNPAEARQAVDTVKKSGLDFVKILSVSHESYVAIADESAKQHIHFVGHIPEAVSVSEASAAGQQSIEHLSGMLLACSSREKELRQQRLQALTQRDYRTYFAAEETAMATYSPDKAAGLFIQLRDNSTWQVPTLVWDRADASIGDPQVTANPWLKYVPLSVRKTWEPELLLKQTSSARLDAEKKELARFVELVRAMRQAGVPFMAGSDGPDPYVFPGFSLHDELELLVSAGFTPGQALQTATFNPALFLGKLDQYGVVEKGRIADLVLLDANPLEDIRNTRRIDSVIVGGKYYSRDDLDKMLSDVEEAAAKK